MSARLGSFIPTCARQWQREAKHRPAQAILCPDGAPVAFDDRARDRQPQPGPLGLGGDECIENVRQVFLANARSGIYTLTSATSRSASRRVRMVKLCGLGSSP